MGWSIIDAEASIQWLKSQLTPVGGPSDINWSGNPLSCCLPPGYDAYLKLFHEIVEDLSVVNRDLTWDQAEDKSAETDDRLRMVLASATLERGVPEDDFPSRRVRWAELAKRYGLKFHSELSVRSFSRRFPNHSWPRYLVGPEEGSLTSDEFAQVLLHLDAFADGERVYMYWDLPMIVQGRDPYCIAGDTSAPAEDVWPQSVDFTPTYIWPEGREWIVHTDYDLSFSLLASTAAIAYELIALEDLEIVKLPYDARIDSGSDTLNG